VHSVPSCHADAQPFPNERVETLELDEDDFARESTGDGIPTNDEDFPDEPDEEDLPYTIDAQGRYQLKKEHRDGLPPPPCHEVVEIIRRDHGTIRQLIDQVELADGSEKIKPALELVRELVMHTFMERTTVYPFLYRKDKEGVVPACLKDHTEIEKHLLRAEQLLGDKKLAPSVAQSQLFEEVMFRIQYDVLQHLMHEEQFLFREAEVVWDKKDLDQLAEMMKFARANAPTTAHQLWDLLLSEMKKAQAAQTSK